MISFIFSKADCRNFALNIAINAFEFESRP